MALSTLGTDPDYASLLGQRQDPRLLMAQKLMDVEKMPTTNASQSSFWANLLNQGARGALGGYLYSGVEADRQKEATAQAAEAEKFRKLIEAGPPSSAPVKDGSGGPRPEVGPGTAPAQPQAALGAGALPPEQQQAIVTAATQGTMVPPELAHALITQESGWKPGARGKGSDTGLGQITDATAADPGYGLPPISTADRLDPAKNAAWSMRYLEARGRAAGLTRPEDWQDPAKVALALKAYNGGGDPNYVANVTSRMQRRADAGPPDAGSNLDALLAGVDAAKPRGIRLAENLVGGTATDAPTPILPDMGDAQGTAAPRLAVASAALPGPAAAAPAMPSPAAAGVPGPALAQPPPPAPADPASLASVNGVPIPSPAVIPAPDAAFVPPIAAAVPPRAETPVVPPPGAALAPPPGLVPPSPAPPLPGADDPYVNQADVPPPPAPTPVLGNNADPLQADTAAPPAALVSPPDAAAVPGPAAATVPPRPVPDGGASRPDLPIPVPPIPPQGGPSGPQLASRLQSPGELAFLQAARDNQPPSGGPIDLFTQAGIASPYTGAPSRGIQLAGPLLPPGAPGGGLVTPTGDTTAAGAPGGATDSSAAGGQGKGAAPAAAQASSPAAIADAQAKADWYLGMARQAAGSSNPRIRANAGVLEAQGMQFQRTADRLTTLNDRLDASREARGIAREDREARAGETAANRAQQREEARQRIDIEKERLNIERTRDQASEDRGLALKGLRWKADSNRTVLEQIPNTSPPAAADFGNSEDAKALNTYRDLYPVLARGQPTEQQRADYEAARNRLLKPSQQISQSGQTIETPGRLPDLGKIYGPIPGEAPIPTEQPLPQGAYRTGSGSIVYPGPQQPVPEKVTTEMLTNVNGLRQVQTAAESLRKNPNAIGPIAGSFPQVTNWFDAAGTPTRAMIAAIGSVKVHDISGAAVTAAEEPRLIPWIPDVRDTKAVALAKLERFATEYGNILRDKYEVYGPDSNHQANPVVERALLASPVEYAGDKAYDHMKSGQVYRAPDGTLRTKQ